jgi:hypothetical protein
VSQALSLLRATWGAALVAVPRLLLPPPRDRAAVAVARVLGARQLAEAAVLRRERSAGRRWVGVVVDAVHAGTAVAAGLRWPRRREQAALNVVTAVALAALGARAAQEER